MNMPSSGNEFLIFYSQLVLFLCTSANEELYMGFCRNDLGMYSGFIPDEALTASSSYDEKSVGPLNSRIRQEKNGGAWCPKKQINKELQEWLQVDLQEVKVISLVETQGRFGNGQGQEFAPNYVLEYQRIENGRWIRYKDKKGAELLKGNSNTYIAELRELRPPIIARRVRFLPWSNHPRTTCMRVELYGCPWTDGVISYSMPQGDKRGLDIDLSDLSYDGQILDGYLSGGLGQLTDFEEGSTNFRLDQYNVGKRGYEWVGWKNDTNSTYPLEIIFHFDQLRNFTGIQVHVNNLIAKEVSIFQRLVIHFSLDGLSYNGRDSVIFDHVHDSSHADLTRRIFVPIPHRIGLSLKLIFFFDARWILISEIRFFSELVKNPEDLRSRIKAYKINGPENSSAPELKDELGEDKERREKDEEANQLLVTWHQTFPFHPNMIHHNLSVFSQSGDNNVTLQLTVKPSARKWRKFDETNLGILIGALIGLLVVVMAFVFAIVCRRYRRIRYRQGSMALKSSLTTDHKSLPLQLVPLSSNSKTSNGLIYRSVATNETRATEAKIINQSQEFNGMPLQRIQESPGCCQLQPGSIYEIPMSYASIPGFGSEVPPIFPEFRSLDPASSCVHQNTAQGLEELKLQESTFDRTLCSSSNTLVSWKDDVTVPEILWEDLVLVQKLGQGQLGEVHLCQLKSDNESARDVTETQNSRSTNSLLVAVKILRQNASQQDWLDFQKEMKILSHLHDPNILRLFGKCNHNGSPATVLEYMEHGDLFQFLRDSILENSKPNASAKRCLSYGSLIYMAMQIASGMKYLENLNLVHRDIATRNCLVGQKYTIKIADFGMSQSVYSNDYCDWEGSDLLPIRWMAWESILLGQFSIKTDVWSFGVTLWEILGLARDRPFSDLTNDEVIDNCEHIRAGDGLDRSLPQPLICPKEIYDLMKQCWSREDVHRPTFREIHMFLQRRNIGYDPDKTDNSDLK